MIEVDQKPVALALVGLAHPHGATMVSRLIDAGAVCAAFCPDADDCQQKPDILSHVPMKSFESILRDESISLIVTAVRPDRRAEITMAALEHGKSVLSAKPGCVTLAEATAIAIVCSRTKQRYWNWFSERLDFPAALAALEAVNSGAIGQLVHATAFAPHRIGGVERPEWFFQSGSYGGILNDLGSHQADLFLALSNGKNPEIDFSAIIGDQTGFEYSGEASLSVEGLRFFFRVDWLSPNGLPVFGDHRLFLTGTDGTIEVRKTIDPLGSDKGGKAIICTADGLSELPVSTGPTEFFRNLLADLRDGGTRTDSAERTCAAVRLSLEIQRAAQMTIRDLDLTPLR